MRALVTGVSKGGIGEAICHQLITDSRVRGGPDPVSLTIAATHMTVELESVARDLKDRGADILRFTGDLKNRITPKYMVEAAVKHADGLDLVVCNAGKTQHGPLLNVTEEEWDDAFTLHVRAAWLLACAAYPYLGEAAGTFIAIGSVTGTMPHAHRGAYAVSKAALISLCQNLALEWAPAVRVNVVSPGLISTARSPKEGRETHVPLNRTGIPSDVAKVVSFLTRESYITGANIVVDGGLTQAGLEGI